MPFSLSKISSVASTDTLTDTLSSGLNHDNQVLTDRQLKLHRRPGDSGPRKRDEDEGN